MELQPGPSATWNPLDDSPESWALGQIMFGDEQKLIRQQAREMRSLQFGVVAKVDCGAGVYAVDFSSEGYAMKCP